MLPSDIDPPKPLDPQLVVGFGKCAEGAHEEIEAAVEQTWSNYPVVIVSQVRSNCWTTLDRLIKGVAVLSNWEGPENSTRHLQFGT